MSAIIHFTTLTPAEVERLVILMEECGEVIQAASKVLRHGWDSTYDNGKTNREQLEIELGDVKWIKNFMSAHNDIDAVKVGKNFGEKAKRMANSPYLHHQDAWIEGLTPDEAFFQKHGHEKHCNLVHMSTLNTEDDHCDCKAGDTQRRVEAVAKAMYENYTSTHPEMFPSSFVSWSDLSTQGQTHWLNIAKKQIGAPR